MAVGKPDFELNSFGIQYKEKKVNYTNKKNIQVPRPMVLTEHRRSIRSL